MSAPAIALGRRRESSGRPPWMEKPSRAALVARALLMAFLAFAMLFPFIYVIAAVLVFAANRVAKAMGEEGAF